MFFTWLIVLYARSQLPAYHLLHLWYCNGVHVTMILFPLSLLRVLTCPCQVWPLSADEKIALPFLSGSSTSAQPSSPSPFISEGTHTAHLKAYIGRYPRSYFSASTNSLLLLSPLYTSMEPNFKSRNLSLFPPPTLLCSENYPFTQCSLHRSSETYFISLGWNPESRGLPQRMLCQGVTSSSPPKLLWVTCLPQRCPKDMNNSP